jgi:hypothetical protein
VTDKLEKGLALSAFLDNVNAAWQVQQTSHWVGFDNFLYDLRIRHKLNMKLAGYS